MLECTALSTYDIGCHRGVINCLPLQGGVSLLLPARTNPKVDQSSLQGLSLPLVREARSGLSSWFSAGKAPSSITDCLAAFTADETLQVGLGFRGPVPPALPHHLRAAD